MSSNVNQFTAPEDLLSPERILKLKQLKAAAEAINYGGLKIEDVQMVLEGIGATTSVRLAPARDDEPPTIVVPQEEEERYLKSRGIKDKIRTSNYAKTTARLLRLRATQKPDEKSKRVIESLIIDLVEGDLLERYCAIAFDVIKRDTEPSFVDEIIGDKTEASATAVLTKERETETAKLHSEIINEPQIQILRRIYIIRELVEVLIPLARKASTHGARSTEDAKIAENAENAFNVVWKRLSKELDKALNENLRDSLASYEKIKSEVKSVVQQVRTKIEQNISEVLRQKDAQSELEITEESYGAMLANIHALSDKIDNEFSTQGSKIVPATTDPLPPTPTATESPVSLPSTTALKSTKRSKPSQNSKNGCLYTLLTILKPWKREK